MCRLRRPAPLREWARGSACLPSAGLQGVNNRTWRSSLSDADPARPPSQASAACNCSSKVSPSNSTACSTSPEGPKTVIEVHAHASLTWACSHARGPALLMVLEVPLRVVADSPPPPGRDVLTTARGATNAVVCGAASAIMVHVDVTFYRARDGAPYANLERDGRGSTRL